MYYIWLKCFLFCIFCAGHTIWGQIFTPGGSLPCQRNVICPENTPYKTQINSTVLLESTWGSSTVDAGTGVILNHCDRDESFSTLYILTAAHVVKVGSLLPTAINIHFNYQTKKCNDEQLEYIIPSDSRLSFIDVQKFPSPGFAEATYQAIISDSYVYSTTETEMLPFDYALLIIRVNTQELRDKLKNQGISFAGWNSMDKVGSTPLGYALEDVHSVSHPKGDIKKIHFDKDPNDYPFSFNNLPGDETFFWVVTNFDNDRFVESGSSGSGLWGQVPAGHPFAGQRFIYGNLSSSIPAGDASCEDFLREALYVKFTKAYNEKELYKWLCPSNPTKNQIESFDYTSSTPNCFDFIQNQGELAVDCGGPCPPCPPPGNIGPPGGEFSCAAITNGIGMVYNPVCYTPDVPLKVSTVVNSNCMYEAEWYSIPPGLVSFVSSEPLAGNASPNALRTETASITFPNNAMPTFPYTLTVGIRIKETFNSTVVFGQTEQDITIYAAPPAPDAGPVTISLCPGESQILGTAPHTGVTYEWLSDNGGIEFIDNPDSPQPVLTASKPGMFTYRLRAYYPGEPCAREDVLTLYVDKCACGQVMGGPQAFAGDDLSTCNQQARLMGYATGGVSPYTFRWSPQSYLDNGYIASPRVINLPATTTYTLEVADANGCISTDVVTVTLGSSGQVLPALLPVTGTLSTTQTFRAQTILGASGAPCTIAPAANVKFYGTKSVRLLPGFVAQKGTQFVAAIQPCGSPDSPPPVGRLADNTTSAAPTLPDKATFSVLPNPFQGNTTLAFSLPESSPVNIALLDALGRVVQTPVSDTYPAGKHSIRFAPGLPAGVYYLRFQSNTSVSTQKVILY